MLHHKKYYQRLLSAMIRGAMQQKHEVFIKHLDDLSEEDHEVLLRLAEHTHLNVNAFLRVEPLPEIVKIMDVIRSVAPDNILEVGCGRGLFLWRLLDEYKNVSITAIDTDAERMKLVSYVGKGGVRNFSAKVLDATSMAEFPKNSFDVTTALRVLEFVNDLPKAIAEICRVTKRFIIAQYPCGQVPSNLPTLEQLVEMFKAQDVMQVKVEQVQNYYVIIARK
jgi:2-polyprenyl-3-methyl-5-hydroxy-6-metoxy-1,4-benzoquinol methylase